MNALVIGYGSIGSRHARILKEIGCSVSVVSSRKIELSPNYQNLRTALISEKPESVVIANNTVEHYGSLRKLLKYGYGGMVLIEKPVFHTPKKITIKQFNNVFVDYNMRFNPILQKLKTDLENERVISIQAYAGQYLPDWRPNRKYETSYSARKMKGGGVLRDLSHELDYITWLLGDWKSVTAIGGHFSNLTIDSDDIYSILMVTQKCPIVNIQLNYLDRVAQRVIIINTEHHLIVADFIKKTLQIDQKIVQFNFDRDLTYRLQHMAVLNSENGCLCTFKEGNKILDLISVIEETNNSKKRIWIHK